MLEVHGLVAGYSDIPLINGVSLTAEKGKITTIIGPNGAGKSTFLKSIFGLLKPKGGRVIFDGRDITGMQPNKLVELGVSFILQRRSIFPELTVDENLEMALWPKRRDRQRVRESIEDVYELFPMLAKYRRTQAYLLSGGEQRILEILRAWMQEPRLLLVDEPTVGLSPKISTIIYDMLLSFTKRQVAILMVDQNIRSAIKISDKVYVMKNGSIVMEGTREEFEGGLKEIVKSWFRYA